MINTYLRTLSVNVHHLPTHYSIILEAHQNLDTHQDEIAAQCQSNKTKRKDTNLYRLPQTSNQRTVGKTFIVQTTYQ